MPTLTMHNICKIGVQISATTKKAFLNNIILIKETSSQKEKKLRVESL